MKKVLTVIGVVALLFVATPSQAQTRFGLKGGYNITSMSLSSDVINKSNRSGFFVGPTIKFTLPIVGLGIDAAALYDQRESEINAITITQKSVNIPINARYSIGLGDMAGIYLAAGPQFGFNVGDTEFNLNPIHDLTGGTVVYTSEYTLQKSNFSVNLGAGLSLIDHLEVGFNYNIALGKTGEVTVGSAAKNIIKTNNNAWQIYAAYYF